MARCENGTEDIISTRSKTYALLNGRIDDMTISELTSFIHENPSILKRPILLSERSMAVGYDHDEITALIPRRGRGRDRQSLRLLDHLSPIL